MVPAYNEKQLFVKFIAEFRKQLGSDPYIRLALSASQKKVDALDLFQLNKLVDSYNIMTYDFTSGSAGDIYTGHHAQPYLYSDDPLFYRKYRSTELATEYYIKSGADFSKINIGVAFYGRGFNISNNLNIKGPFIQSYKAISFGTLTTGILEYYDIKQNYMSDSNNFLDSLAMAPYILNEQNKIFITYEDEKSIREKHNIVQNKGLQGLFAYELTGDDANSTLLNAMRKGKNNSRQIYASSDNKNIVFNLMIFIFLIHTI